MQKAVPVNLTAVGIVEPFTSVAVKARVDGQILSVAFKEGDEVKKGATLFEIDPRPFAACASAGTGKQAEGSGAPLASRRAGRFATRNFSRRISFPPTRTVRYARITKQQPRRSRPTRRRSRQRSSRSTTARSRSPVTGYAGRILIQQGNLVKANDTNPLVTINQVVPIYVSFSVPEQNITDIRKFGSAGTLHVRAHAADAAHAPIEGSLASLDNSADPATGTIRLRAAISEPGQSALAGPVRQRRSHVARTTRRDRDTVEPRCRTARTANTCSS
jgi:multidrug efflux system membrane fusion protein